jgi:hypothetical protein
MLDGDVVVEQCLTNARASRRLDHGAFRAVFGMRKNNDLRHIFSVISFQRSVIGE